ncbi:MAG: transposase, partial [Firmicutes bacterium]|nr:transposase [Bacillota bacterium]
MAPRRPNNQLPVLCTESYPSWSLVPQFPFKFYLFSPLIDLQKILLSAIIQIRGKFHEKRDYTQEFKEQILRECQEVGNVAVVARRHNISPNTIHTWRSKA